MFTSKLPAFTVPKIYKFLNSTRLVSCKFHRNSATLYKKNQSSKNFTDFPKCKEYLEKLSRCPKPSEAVRCCKTFFKKPAPKCKEQTTFEDYRGTCENITNRAKLLLKDVREKLSCTLQELDSYVESAKANEDAELGKLSSSNKAKLSELMSLDVSFGSVKRKCALYLNHRSREHIQSLRCDLMARIRKLRELAERIERDASICADRAELLVRSCRKCLNVQALQECIKENSDSATKILEDGSKCAEDSLKEIVAYKQNIIKYYDAISAEAIKTYSRENAMFAEYLDDCIFALKEKRK